MFNGTVTGRITGVVTDPPGAVVSSATVMIITNETNDDSAFLVAVIHPGSYTVMIEARGFKKFPNPNSIQELKVLTCNHTADYGNKHGGT